MTISCSGCGRTVEEILDDLIVGEGMTFHVVGGKMYCEPCYAGLSESDRESNVPRSSKRIILYEAKENNTFDVVQTV